MRPQIVLMTRSSRKMGFPEGTANILASHSAGMSPVTFFRVRKTQQGWRRKHFD